MREMIKAEEIKTGDLSPMKFIEQKGAEITSTVDDSLAIDALSGGVDSAAVTMLGHSSRGYKPPGTPPAASSLARPTTSKAPWE